MKTKNAKPKKNEKRNPVVVASEPAGITVKKDNVESDDAESTYMIESKAEHRQEALKEASAAVSAPNPVEKQAPVIQGKDPVVFTPQPETTSILSETPEDCPVEDVEEETSMPGILGNGLVKGRGILDAIEREEEPRKASRAKGVENLGKVALKTLALFIGMPILYFPNGVDFIEGNNNFQKSCPGIITSVLSDDDSHANLVVFPDAGQTIVRTSVHQDKVKEIPYFTVNKKALNF